MNNRLTLWDEAKLKKGELESKQTASTEVDGQAGSDDVEYHARQQLRH